MRYCVAYWILVVLHGTVCWQWCQPPSKLKRMCFSSCTGFLGSWGLLVMGLTVNFFHGSQNRWQYPCLYTHTHTPLLYPFMCTTIVSHRHLTILSHITTTSPTHCHTFWHMHECKYTFVWYMILNVIKKRMMCDVYTRIVLCEKEFYWG